MTVLHLGVDAACFFLFNPYDFVDEHVDGELEPPDLGFDEALVIGLQLGADGHRAVDVQVGAISAEEEQQCDGPIRFPLRVQQGRLFATDRMAGVDDFDWDDEPAFVVEPGLYEALWFRANNALMEERNVNWLVRLRAVESLDGLPEWRDFPHEDQFDL